MALILDTNGMSGFVDGNKDLRKAISGERDLLLPVIVLGEYLYGIRHSRLRAQYEQWLRENLKLFLVLHVGAISAARYAEIRSELKEAGRPIPANDLWIAALAREHGYPIVSRDSHFDAVRGVKRLPW